MRIAALTLLGAIAFAGTAPPVLAAPIAAAPPAPQVTNVVPAAAGCGWRFHRNRWGRCVPNRYGFYRPYRYRNPYWGGPYGYGYGYEPWNRPSPTDRVANQLNRRQLYGY